MLELLRRAVKSWFAKLLLGLLVVSFAVWGIGDVFTGGSATKVAQVGDESISAEEYSLTLRQEMRRLTRTTGQPIDIAQARAFGLDRYVLARLARDAALDGEVKALGVSAPDDAVRELVLTTPAFQTGAGVFSPEAYDLALSQAGMSRQMFEDDARAALTRGIVTGAVASVAAPPPGAAEAIARYRGETRSYEYIVVTAEEPVEGEAAPAPDDAALQALLDADPDRFAAPETRAGAYLNIDIRDIAKTIEGSEEEARALYESRRLIYDRAERREVSQVVFTTLADAEAARARLDAGAADFDAIIAERGLTPEGASLGLIEVDALPEATGSAAFALERPGVAGPVDTGFGFALLSVEGILPASTLPYEDVAEELRSEVALDEARDLAPARAAEIEDARAGGAQLEEIAIRFGLPLGTFADLDAAGDGARGLTATPRFLTELFTAEEGEERDLVETADGGYFVLRVDSVTPSRPRTLDEARADLEAAHAAEAAQEALRLRIEAAAAELEGGAAIADVAATYGATVETGGPVTRADDPAPLDQAGFDALFAAEPGAVVSAVGQGGGVVASLTEIGGPEDMDALIAETRAALEQSIAGDQLEFYARAVEAEIGATVNEAALDALMTRMTGF